MTPHYYFAAAATAVAVVALLLAEGARSRLRAAIAKPLASAGFLAAAWHAGAMDSAYGRIVLSGLVLSALGDVLLLPAGKAFFLAGLGSFLLSHLAFAAAFLERGVAAAASIGAALVLCAAALFVWRWLAAHVPAPMRIAVLAYMAAITAMVALAVGTTWKNPSWTLLAGTTAFYVSDLSVARDEFVSEGFVNRAWGLPLYYAGQLLIAASVAHA